MWQRRCCDGLEHVARMLSDASSPPIVSAVRRRFANIIIGRMSRSNHSLLIVLARGPDRTGGFRRMIHSREIGSIPSVCLERGHAVRGQISHVALRPSSPFPLVDAALQTGPSFRKVLGLLETSQTTTARCRWSPTAPSERYRLRRLCTPSGRTSDAARSLHPQPGGRSGALRLG